MGGGGAGAANTGRGGALLNAGNLTAEDCQFRGSQAVIGGGAFVGWMLTTSPTLSS